jgi:hypothetical protein
MFGGRLFEACKLAAWGTVVIRSFERKEAKGYNPLETLNGPGIRVANCFEPHEGATKVH